MELIITVAKNRLDKSCKTLHITWPELVKKLSITKRTPETFSDYVKMTKDQQAVIKDIGGFIGGELSGGRRKKNNVINRCLLTLDLDDIDNKFWAGFTLDFDNAACIYSTHKHSVRKPRYRLVMPLNRPCTSDEYQAVGRKVADILCMDRFEGFDRTTFQASRLMYWPSTSVDGAFEFKQQDGDWLDVDAVLAMYADWRDQSQWPFISETDRKITGKIKKLGNPGEKDGMVGAFCRAYTISEAIEKFLGDVYTSSDEFDDRYTYVEGTTANGLVIYDNDHYCYSHHNTDPISGKLCNAFDLVRLHKFGDADDRAKEDTPINKLPSYNKMLDFARVDGAVKKQLLKVARDEFALSEVGVDEFLIDDSWKERLEVDRKGVVQPTINNMVLIVENDLRGCIGFNLLLQQPMVLKRLPWDKDWKGERYWLDADDSSLRHFIENNYQVVGVNKIDDALKIVFKRCEYHPVHDYLNTLVWDGQERVNMLLVDYFGAEDSDYVRMVMRKSLLACVKRVYEPGCKVDNVLTLVGPQGSAKSTFLRKLGRNWFSDSFDKIEGKEAVEAVLGKWIIEMGELNALKKAEVNAVKHFISKQDDQIRLAYAKHSGKYLRQCVFFATTNEDDFLRDTTGNRRWWPVVVHKNAGVKNVFSDLDADEVDQIWAEVYHAYNHGEHDLHLPDAVEELAKQIQLQHTEYDERQSIIERYLDMPIPDNWASMNVYDRRAYIRQDSEDIVAKPTGEKRNRVTIYEIWVEALGFSEKEMTKYATRDIHNIMKNIPGWARHDHKIRLSKHDGGKAYRGYIRVSNVPDYDFLN